jgi:hypothetical protein
VALALHELGRAALRPDRLADAAQARAGGRARRDELAPDGDDPGGIAADQAHVGEGHPAGVGAELGAQALDPRGADDDEDRLLGHDGGEDERQRAVQEAVLSCVEQGFVTEATLRPRPLPRFDCRHRPRGLLPAGQHGWVPRTARGDASASCAKGPTGRST